MDKNIFFPSRKFKFTPFPSYPRFVYKHPELIKYIKQNPSEIPLGCESRDFNIDELVTVPFNKNKRFTCAIQGNNDSGKSVLTRSLVYDGLHDLGERDILFFDLKLDSHTLIHENNNAKQIKILNRFGRYPKKREMRFVTPFYLSRAGAYADEKHKFSISPKSINSIANLEKRLSFLCKLWNTTIDEPVGQALQEIWIKNDPPNSMVELDYIMMVLSEGEGRKTPPKLLARYSLLKQMGILGENDLNFPKLLAESKLLTFEGVLPPENQENLQDLFIMKILNDFISDREKSIISKNKQGYTHKPPTIVIEEASLIAGRLCMSADEVEAILTRYREPVPEMKQYGIHSYGFDLVLTTQHFASFSKIINSEVDNLITSRVTSEADFDIIKSRGYRDYSFVYDLDKSEYPYEHVLINRNGETQTFYPFASTSLT